MSFRGGGRGRGRGRSGGSRGGRGRGRGGGGRGRGGRGRGRGGGRGRGRGRGGRGGGASSNKVVVQKYDLPGLFYYLHKDNEVILTQNLDVGVSVYDEKRIPGPEGEEPRTEFRVWNPFRSKLGAAVLNGIKPLHIKPGAKLLYLGAANGTTVSHCSDIVGPEGGVYAVEISPRSGRELIALAQRRKNIFPILMDARHPAKYRMLCDSVDVMFADVAQRNQAQILGVNAAMFLKNGGHFLISIKANCIDSTVAPEKVYESEIEKLKSYGFEPESYVTLDPFERDHAMVVGTFRSGKSS